jgi:ribosomal protein S18 acetylase RimI-like enzyme
MMQETTQVLTARRATPEDIPFLAWCNYEASSPEPGFCYWDPPLEGTNTETMTFIEAVFHADALAWGKVENFFILEEEGRCIAGASAFTMDANDYRPLSLASFSKVAQRLSWTSQLQEKFLKGYQDVWSYPKDETLAPHTSWIIECVAVTPEKRGRGVAGILLEKLFNEGRRLGHPHVGISVTDGNEAAKRAYEKAGFKMYLIYGSDYFDGYFPGTVKYRLKL